MPNPSRTIPLKPRPHVREALDMAAELTGKSMNEIINDAVEWYLPQIGTDQEENRLKLLKEFKKRFPAN